MTGQTVYEKALISLGYSKNTVTLDKAIVVINQIYDELFDAAEVKEYKLIKSLANEINLPERKFLNAMTYGVAERLALGEGDGELQQYFYAMFQKAKARLTRFESVMNVLPTGDDEE